MSISMSQPMVAVGLIGLQLTTTSLVVGFAKRDSPLRLGAIVAMLLAAYSQLSHPRVQHPIARPFLGAASVFLVIMYIDAALLSRWTFDAGRPTSSLGGLDPSLGRHDSTSAGSTSTSGPSRRAVARLRFGFDVALQSRFPGTPWAAKNTPGFARSRVPSRAWFLARNVLECALCIFLLRLSSSLGDPSQSAVLFSSARIPLAGNIIILDPSASPLSWIDLEQLGTRLLGVLGYWTVQYLIINLLYGSLATLAVALHITGVDVWPPVFGRLDES